MPSKAQQFTFTEIRLRRPLPTLFGRVTTTFSGHDHLGSTLEVLRRMCMALESEASTALDAELTPGPLISDLLGNLSQHFAAEETDAYFGAVVAERPIFLRRILELKAEHAAMLETLLELRGMADDRLRWNAIAVPMLRFIGALHAHEQVEAMLLQEYFDQEESETPD